MGEKGFYRGSGVSFYIRHPNKARPCTSGNGRAVSVLARPPGYIMSAMLSQNGKMVSKCPLLRVFTEL